MPRPKRVQVEVFAVGFSATFATRDAAEDCRARIVAVARECGAGATSFAPETVEATPAGARRWSMHAVAERSRAKIRQSGERSQP